MKKLKIRQIGNSLGVVLPKDALAAHKLEEGDEVQLVEVEHGWLMRAYDPDLEDAQAWIEKGAKRYKNTLRVLSQ